MAFYSYLVRFPSELIPDMLARREQPGGAWPTQTLLELTHDGYPDTQICIGKSPHSRATSVQIPAVVEAVHLHHDLPEAFYAGLHEQWVGVFQEMDVRYSLPQEVQDVAARLPRNPRYPEILAQAHHEREEQLRTSGYSTGLSREGTLASLMSVLVPFYDAACTSGQAVLHSRK